MSGKLLIIACIANTFICFGSAEAQSGPGIQCDRELSEWAEAFDKLESSMDSYRSLKEGSVASKLKDRLGSEGSAIPIAQAVRSVLLERIQMLNREVGVCDSAADTERRFFEQWRRCKGSARTNDQAENNLLKERSARLAELSDLLIDEAYAQYKKDQPNPTTFSANQNQNRAAGWGSYDNVRQTGGRYGGYGYQ